MDFYVGDHAALFPKLTKQALAYQVSDHLPLWVQTNADIDASVSARSFKADQDLPYWETRSDSRGGLQGRALHHPHFSTLI